VNIIPQVQSYICLNYRSTTLTRLCISKFDCVILLRDIVLTHAGMLTQYLTKLELL